MRYFEEMSKGERRVERAYLALVPALRRRGDFQRTPAMFGGSSGPSSSLIPRRIFRGGAGSREEILAHLGRLGFQMAHLGRQDRFERRVGEAFDAAGSNGSGWYPKELHRAECKFTSRDARGALLPVEDHTAVVTIRKIR